MHILTLSFHPFVNARRLGVLTLALALVLCGCATRLTVDPDPLLADSQFKRPATLPDAAGLFALDAPMRRHLDAVRHAAGPSGERHRLLLSVLYEAGDLRLDYDASRTRTASEAFDEQVGNCLSLVVMTAAFAKELGLPVSYRSAVFDEIWSRQGDLRFRSGHINLSLGTRRVDRMPGTSTSPMTIDFYPPELIRGLRTVPVQEHTVVAMYMNNRAAETLVDGRIDQAYWYAREAVRQDPGFAGGVNTLGVIYLRRGLLPQAERALRQALVLAPRHAPAVANLVQVLDRQGRSEEAQAMRLRLAQIDPHPAFADFDRGVRAAERGDWRTARDLFERELAHVQHDAEIHYWLARSYIMLGNRDKAREHLTIAAEIGTTQQERARYAAKLAGLKGTSTH